MKSLVKLNNLKTSTYLDLYSNILKLYSFYRLIIQEFPDFAQILEGPFSENGIKIPSRPVSQGDGRPATGSSQRSLR